MKNVLAIFISFFLAGGILFSQGGTQKKLFPTSLNQSTARRPVPVPGARVTVYLEPSGPAIARCIANTRGEITFAWPGNPAIPDSGIFRMTVKPPVNKIKGAGGADIAMLEKVFQVKFKKRWYPDRIFHYTIHWNAIDPDLPAGAQNKGTFAVSGKSSA